MDLRGHISALPLTSGVYIMRDKHGRVIYIGKAVNLRRRVQSYFSRSLDIKGRRLIAEIADIDYLSTNSEAEALLLEASLIRKYKPKYNIELRDDKSYPYIYVTKEEFARIDIIRIPPKDKLSSYSKKIQQQGKLYGPYVNPRLIRQALQIIRRIFPYRTCSPLPNKVCLDFHIGLCNGPCEGKVSKMAYRKNIRKICLILGGKKEQLYKTLQREMEDLARKKEFEKAAKIRDQLRAIGALYSGTKDINTYKEAEQLQRLLHLSYLPRRIEAFDISNIMGELAVGSMVSFFNGKPDKQNYRRFRIKGVDKIDDFQMIAEVVRRRYYRLKKEKAPLPDLILIDGGKGQLSSAVKELEKLGLEIPIISLAKREEQIFLPRRRVPILLPKDSLGLQLVQRIRDEAHRFAVSYHRKLRNKKVW